MFKNNKINMVLSIIIAIFLWIYVVGQINPETTKKVAGVTVNFLNEELLANEGLALVDPGDLAVTVSIKGTRAAVKKVNAEDITVTADLSGFGKGKNTLALQVEVPNDIQLMKVDPENITVVVEDSVTVEKKIQVVTEGTLKEGSEVGNLKLSTETVEVTGAKSSVAKVDHVKATVKTEDIRQENTKLPSRLVAVDKEGKEIHHLSLSKGTVNITASLLATKMVSLNATTTGEVSSTVQLESLEVPDKITIKGPENLIKTIEKITAKPTDISGIKETTTVPLSLELPEGIELAEKNKNIGVKVVIKDLATATLEFTGDTIATKNLAAGQTAKINTAKIGAQVKGKDSVLAGLTAADIQAYVDLSGLAAGTHSVKVLASYSKAISNIGFTPEVVEVIISEE
ncbi:MAG: CdaR family protein [Anaerovoracaceae bacterium]